MTRADTQHRWKSSAVKRAADASIDAHCSDETFTELNAIGARVLPVATYTGSATSLLDPLGMAARGLTTQDVELAIRSANAEIPGGRVEGQEREFSVRTMGELQDPAEFACLAQPGNLGLRFRGLEHHAAAIRGVGSQTGRRPRRERRRATDPGSTRSVNLGALVPPLSSRRSGPRV